MANSTPNNIDNSSQFQNDNYLSPSLQGTKYIRKDSFSNLQALATKQYETHMVTKKTSPNTLGYNKSTPILLPLEQSNKVKKRLHVSIPSTDDIGSLHEQSSESIDHSRDTVYANPDFRKSCGVLNIKKQSKQEKSSSEEELSSIECEIQKYYKKSKNKTTVLDYLTQTPMPSGSRDQNISQKASNADKEPEIWILDKKPEPLITFRSAYTNFINFIKNALNAAISPIIIPSDIIRSTSKTASKKATTVVDYGFKNFMRKYLSYTDSGLVLLPIGLLSLFGFGTSYSIYYLRTNILKGVSKFTLTTKYIWRLYNNDYWWLVLGGVPYIFLYILYQQRRLENWIIFKGSGGSTKEENIKEIERDSENTKYLEITDGNWVDASLNTPIMSKKKIAPTTKDFESVTRAEERNLINLKASKILANNDLETREKHHIYRILSDIGWTTMLMPLMSKLITKTKIWDFIFNAAYHFLSKRSAVLKKVQYSGPGSVTKAVLSLSLFLFIKSSVRIGVFKNLLN